MPAVTWPRSQASIAKNPWPWPQSLDIDSFSGLSTPREKKKQINLSSDTESEPMIRARSLGNMHSQGLVI